MSDKPINLTNISGLFKKSDDLWDDNKIHYKKLPDISKWNTKNVTDMNSLFCGCKCLLKLPDISKWNTNNVKDFSGIFKYCK